MKEEIPDSVWLIKIVKQMVLDLHLQINLKLRKKQTLSMQRMNIENILIETLLLTKRSHCKVK